MQMQLWRTDDKMNKKKELKCSFYGLKPKHFLFVCILLYNIFILFIHKQEIVRMQFEIYFLRLSLYSHNPSLQIQ